MVRNIRLPQIPKRDYKITDFGARSGEAVEFHPAILAAIKKASAAGG